jgi:uncharacterized protein YciI
VDYFFYCRVRPGSGEPGPELAEAHWAFMDRYAETMIARGPTLSPDGEGWTGSMHIVNLPDSAAAHEFAFDEPQYKAGVYSEVLIRRWRNALGRTMWEFAGSTAGYRRFLIIAHGKTAPSNSLESEHRHYLDRNYRERLIAYGPLVSQDGAEWVGTALLVELPDRDAAETMMRSEPYQRNGLYENVEIHDWQFGGRPQA